MLKVFNTLSRQIEQFKPRESGKIRMFTCGPSVYRRPHIGNYRTFLYEDLLQRYLEYIGYDVTRLISLTDIEDKAIVEAEREHKSVKRLAEINRKIFSKDSEFLRIKSPTYSACMMVCSSTAVEEVAKLIEDLMEKNYAYYHKHKGRRNVYYDSLKFEDFGKLSKLDMSKWPKRKRRFHRDTYPGNRWNLGDFILWHGYKEGDADYWDTEIGQGRPSWNIQDAATITKYLGFTVDIACGGIDNLARHHDYTIAIVEGVSGEKFANYWFHGQHLFVHGKKMSKSKGNVYYPSDLARMGYTGDHVRFFLIYSHYRKRLNFTIEEMKSVSEKLDLFKSMVSHLQKTKSGESSRKAKRLVDNLLSSFEENMNNDLNVKDAFDTIFSTLKKLDNLRKSGKLSYKDARTATDKFRQIDNVLQIIF